MIVNTKLTKRFFNKVRKTSDCWVWEGARNSGGYGNFKVDKRVLSAHRAAFFLFNGYSPTICVLHRCDNKGCVNPEHLYAGTKKDNTRDFLNSGRFIVPAREKNGRSKLTADNVALIRRIAMPGDRQYGFHALGRRFGVHYSNIARVVRGTGWQ